MAEVGLPWWGLRWSVGVVVTGFLVVALVIGSVQETFQQDASTYSGTEKFNSGYLNKVLNFVWRPSRLGYEHVWPVSLTFLPFLMGFIVCFSFKFEMLLLYCIIGYAGNGIWMENCGGNNNWIHWGCFWDCGRSWRGWHFCSDAHFDYRV